MRLRNYRKSVAALAGTAFVATLGASYAAQADEAPFVANELDGGYLLAAKDAEGKCGEGKCGESKDDAKDGAEGKCGEGKCGGAA